MHPAFGVLPLCVAEGREVDEVSVCCFKQPPKIAVIIRTLDRSMVSSCSEATRSQWYPNACQWPRVPHSSSPLYAHTLTPGSEKGAASQLLN